MDLFVLQSCCCFYKSIFGIILYFDYKSLDLLKHESCYKYLIFEHFSRRCREADLYHFFQLHAGFFWKEYCSILLYLALCKSQHQDLIQGRVAPNHALIVYWFALCFSQIHILTIPSNSLLTKTSFQLNMEQYSSTSQALELFHLSSQFYTSIFCQDPSDHMTEFLTCFQFFSNQLV